MKAFIQDQVTNALMNSQKISKGSKKHKNNQSKNLRTWKVVTAGKSEMNFYYLILVVGKGILTR